MILHRAALYKEVWQTPVAQLAKKYNLSDKGLAKVCKRMKIPLPPRGYWAKQTHGHDVRRRALKPLKGDGEEQVIINRSVTHLTEMARKRQANGKEKHKERQRIYRLQAELKDWEMSQRVRAYIAAMKTSEDDASDNAAFLVWAETYANHLDPAVDYRIQILDEI